MQIPIEQLIRILIREARARKVVMFALFGFLSVVVLVVGANWPKKYVSTTTLFADQKNIIRPLLEGSATLTQVTDHANFCREVIFSRALLEKILDVGGWLESNPSAVQKEQIINQIKGRTHVSNRGKGLISIQYTDSNPERAFNVTLKFAELFIQHSSISKQQESQAAYEFVGTQVDEYHEKLLLAEKRLKEFRSRDMDTRPGGEADVYENISTLKMRIEESEMELREQKIRKTSIEKQLAGEQELVSSELEAGIYQEQIADMEEQLSILRLTYHDTYPDIVRIKQQIQVIRDTAAAEREERTQLVQLARSSESDNNANNVRFSALYEELQSELAKSTTSIETLKTRISNIKERLAKEVGRAKKIHDREAELSELTRDYEVNRNIYQDLLHRKETARVSMHLDIEGQGLKFRLQEPANFPLVPSGFRFLHFFLLGPVLGVLAPLALLFVFIQFDPRIRFEANITENLGLPLLATIPHVRLVNEQPHREYMIIIGIVFVVVLVYGITVWSKLSGVQLFF